MRELWNKVVKLPRLRSPSRESDSEAEAAAAEENTLPRPEAELEDEYQDRGAGDTDTDSSHVRQYSSRTWPREKYSVADRKYLQPI